MKSPLRIIRSPNLNDYRKGKVKPCCSSERAFKGLGLGLNRKAISQIPIYLLLLALVVAMGYLIYQGTVKKGDVTGTPASPPDTSLSDVVESPPATDCPKGQLLDNSGKCIIPPCPTGQARDNMGKCIVVNPNVNPGFNPLPSETECKPSGYFKSAYAYHKKRVGDSSNLNRGAPLSFQFVVTSECDANYYVEAGLLSKTANPLTILVTQPSACDGSPHFAGKFVNGNRNTKFTSSQPAGIIDVAFFPQDYGREEELTLVGGVYSNCLNNGGRTIIEVPPQKLTIRNVYTDTEITNSVTKII